MLELLELYVIELLKVGGRDLSHHQVANVQEPHGSTYQEATS